MSLFYDLTDSGTSESHDELDLTTSDLIDVMDDCEILEGSSWISPTGIDHLIWCLEAHVDSSITGGSDYFQSRGIDPTNENQSNHSWAQDDVRTLWLKNLYDVNG